MIGRRTLMSFGVLMIVAIVTMIVVVLEAEKAVEEIERLRIESLYATTTREVAR